MSVFTWNDTTIICIDTTITWFDTTITWIDTTITSYEMTRQGITLFPNSSTFWNVPLTRQPGSICTSFQWTGSTPAGFHEAFRAGEAFLEPLHVIAFLEPWLQIFYIEAFLDSFYIVALVSLLHKQTTDTDADTDTDRADKDTDTY